MKLEHVDIKTLKPDPGNARRHDKRNLQAIADSLNQFGQRKPIVVTADGIVLAGNGTLEAAKLLGWDMITITRTPADWDFDTARAFALADNRSAELAEWDEEVLKATLYDLDANGWEVTMLGFDPLEAPGVPEIFEDVPPEPKPDPISRFGQLYQLGEHRLKVGNSLDKDDYDDLLQGELVDCIWTDPPYHVAYVGKTAEALVIENDAMSDAQFEEFLETAYLRMYEASKPGGAIYVAHSDTGGGVFRRSLISSGFMLKQCLIWVKNHFVFSRQDYHWQHEPVLYGWKPGAAHKWTGTRTRSTVLDDEKPLNELRKADLLEIVTALREYSTGIREDRPGRSVDHPTMKPVKLVARMIANNTDPGDLVLDPFGGSGSTLIAAAQLGRRCYTIEMDPRYADVIIKRWENLTGEKAELLSPL